MIIDRWEHVKDLLHQALQIVPEQRGQFLDEACASDAALRAEVESLLLAGEDVRSSFLQAAYPGLEAKDPPGGLEAGQTFAQRFQLVRKLGEGGMGQVWLAGQTSPVRRQVALKLIKAGMYDQAVVHRFQSERQSLAIMDHPAIAKVFDAGTTPQGQPYFVMEYVPGLPITEYCDQKKLKIKDRLELFIQACEGVQHAHQKAILHRDLKPANILVVEVDGKPTPRIIDFGLAKATTPGIAGESLVTQLGSLVGTPGYMSPEQADPAVQDVDTRADVYSLGVILYVLLTGALPLDTKQWKNQPLHEVLRKLRDEEPPSPSIKVNADRNASTIAAEARGTDPRQLENLLRGDLDWITMKALEKDRARRYGAPSELAADIRRHLHHEPIVARPASTLYRLRKYARRHRVAVAVIAGLVLLFGAFSFLQTLELRRITRERDRANRERDRATRITDFMTGMFKVSDPSEARGNNVTAREILDKASKDIDSGLGKNPDIQAQMMHVMGNVYLNLGLYSQGELLLSRAVEIRRKVLGPEHPDTLASMQGLARALDSSGHFPEAEKLLRQTLEIERRVSGPESPETLATMNGLANTVSDEGHNEEGEKLYRQVLDADRRVLGPENPDTLKLMGNVAALLLEEGKYPEAEKLQRETLDIGRRVRGPEHPDTLVWMDNLANILQLERHYPEAAKLHREALDIELRTLGPEHPSTLISMSNLASALEQMGQYPEAEKLCRAALEVRRRVLGPEHPDTLMSTSDFALVLGKEGRYAEAEKLLHQTRESQRRVLGAKHPDTAASTYSLACLAAWRGKPGEAVSLLREALDNGLDQDHSLGMEHDPDLGGLQGNPGFKALLKDIQLRAAAAPGP